MHIARPDQSPIPRRRIAVVGAGIAGLSAAWLLRDTADVTLFEAEDRAGGHADTQLVTLGGEQHAVDTGFIVYNETNYPNLTALFGLLGTETKTSEMGFGVSLHGGRLEYAGGRLAQVFAQPRNALRPRFLGMLRDILRFYRNAPALLGSGSGETLGRYLDREGYGDAFLQDHILPMGAAIWSAPPEAIRDFPARQFAEFFANHGLLKLRGRPQWRSVAGGSRRYVAAMLSGLAGRVRLGQAVRAVRRTAQGVEIGHDGGAAQFDSAVLACHADRALALIGDPTPGERRTLGAFRFADNLAVLHTDSSLMPRRRAVWSAWNYLGTQSGASAGPVCLTYWMNCLQRLTSAEPLLVSLNPSRMPPDARILRTRTYRHPQFDTASFAARDALPAIQGQDRLWFAGAWTGWGFHEDGIASAVRVARALGAPVPWDAPLARVSA